MKKSRRTCAGKHFRHLWFRNRYGRQECERCGKLNPLGVPAWIRFWDFVHKTDACWVWTGRVNHGGYGYFRTSVGPNHRNIRAHRYSWFLHYGWLPESGLDLHHTCNTRACVNVEHLRVVTHRDNLRASPTYGICKKGHKIEGPNEYKPPKGGRRCRRCWLAYRKKTSQQS